MEQSTQHFIERARDVWGDRWDYSITEYKTSRTHLKIRCNEHGDVFEQNPYSHLHLHVGCPSCKQQTQLTTEKVISRCVKKFGDRWDYSKVNVVNSRTPITIICREHGEFQQYIHSHCSGLIGCEHCRTGHGRAKTTTSEFIAKAIEAWGDRWDYSKTVYSQSHKHLIITCPTHGDFTQTPMNHLRNYVGCPECKEQAKHDRASTTTEFIGKAKAVWGDRFDYTKTVYRLSRSKVVITCPTHGDFEQIANNHLSGMNGCAKCCKSLNRKTDDFIKKAQRIWGKDRWDYSKSVYKGVNEPITITCKKHGDFEQKPSGHLREKCGCNSCKRMPTYTTAFFIERAKEIWGDRFDYSELKYEKAVLPVTIICREHGRFKQTPSLHIKGYVGCPKCRKSKTSKFK